MIWQSGRKHSCIINVPENHINSAISSNIAFYVIKLYPLLSLYIRVSMIVNIGNTHRKVTALMIITIK